MIPNQDCSAQVGSYCRSAQRTAACGYSEALVTVNALRK